MYHSVYDEKLNLLAWAIRLIFSDQVTYKDLSVYSNVAATFLATIESFRYAYKRNPVISLVLE